jgi:hypothetical protein
MERDTRSRRFLEEVKAGYGAVAATSGTPAVSAGPAPAPSPEGGSR